MLRSGGRQRTRLRRSAWWAAASSWMVLSGREIERGALLGSPRRRSALLADPPGTAAEVRCRMDDCAVPGFVEFQCLPPGSRLIGPRKNGAAKQLTVA